jgi:hypothetical protein
MLTMRTVRCQPSTQQTAKTHWPCTNQGRMFQGDLDPQGLLEDAVGLLLELLLCDRSKPLHKPIVMLALKPLLLPPALRTQCPSRGDCGGPSASSGRKGEAKRF